MLIKFSDPCSHNRCAQGSKCVINLDADLGYDCECAWPTAADPERFGPGKEPVGKAGFSNVNGCVVQDIRNVQDGE